MPNWAEQNGFTDIIRDCCLHCSGAQAWISRETRFLEGLLAQEKQKASQAHAASSAKPFQGSRMQPSRPGKTISFAHLLL